MKHKPEEVVEQRQCPCVVCLIAALWGVGLVGDDANPERVGERE